MKKTFSLLRQFYQQYSASSDRIFLFLILITLTLGSACLFGNTYFFHYPTILLFSPIVTTSQWIQAGLALLFSAIFFGYSLFIREESPWASTFLWGIGAFTLVCLSNIVIVNGIQSTPFQPIDAWLLQLDRLCGIHTSKMLAWLQAHSSIHDFFNSVYDGLVIELLGIPLILTSLNAKKSLTVFYLAFLVSTILGCLIYYFFPTMAPSGVVHSPYFLSSQQHTSLRFLEIHHFVQPSVSDGGLVAFPSFHVIWAVLLTYACRSNNYFFYFMVIYNTLLIISTVVLGWHYLADVVGGIVIAVMSICYANRVSSFSS